MLKRTLKLTLALMLAIMLVPEVSVAFAASSDAFEDKAPAESGSENEGVTGEATGEESSDSNADPALDGEGQNGAGEGGIEEGVSGGKEDDSLIKEDGTNQGGDEGDAESGGDDDNDGSDGSGDNDDNDGSDGAEADETPEAQAVSPTPRTTRNTKAERAIPKGTAKPKGTPIQKGRYIIRSALSQTQVIDISGASKANGANVQLYASNMTSAQLFEFSYDKKGLYTIKNVNSKRVLDVSGGQAKSGTNVWQYGSNNSKAQKWVLSKNKDGSYTFTSALSKTLVLDVSGAGSADGTNIQVYRSNKTAAQKFFITPRNSAVKAGKANIKNGLYTIRSSIKQSYVIDVPGASRASGIQMQLYTANGTTAQVLEIKKTKDGYYTLSPMSSKSRLCLKSGNVVATTPIVQSAKPARDSDKFVITKNGDNTYTFTNKKSGLVIDVSGGIAKNLSKIQAYYPNKTKAQKFTFTSISDDPLKEGVINLIPYNQTGKCVDIAGGSRSVGANAQAYSANGTLAQKFQAKRIATNTYTFSSLNSGLYLTATGTNVDQRGGGTKDSQKWRAKWVHGGFTLTNAATGKMMTLTGSTKAGHDIRLSTAKGTSYQIFNRQRTATLPLGTYQIYTPGNKYIGTTGAATLNGTNVKIYAKSNSASLKWNLVGKSSSSDYFKIACVRSGRVLDVAGGRAADKTNIRLYNSNGSAAQFFKAVPAGGGWFYLQSSLGSNIYIATSSKGNKNGENVRITTKVANAQRFRFNATTSTRPGYHLINAPAIRQLPELPTGCEITAVAIMINGYGVRANKVTLARQMPYSDNPDRGYVGDPFTTEGWTIYPPALVSMIKSYTGQAQVLTGTSLNNLRNTLWKGKPVVVWTTMHGFGVHAITLVGYDSGGFYYNDPWTGGKNVYIGNSAFDGNWATQGRRAVTC